MAPNIFKISILGTGNMGRALGLRFAALGHHVFFAGRDPGGAPLLAAQMAGGTASSGTLDKAADFGEVLIWTARERDPSKVFSGPDALGKLEGKIIIDLNNRDYANELIGNEEARWFDTSLGEALQAAAPNTRVVKAFNTVAMEALDTSAESLRESQAQIFLAGNDDGARQIVNEVAASLGFECVDLGPGKVAMRAAEALGDVIRFIIIDGQKGAKANICVKMLQDPDLNLIGKRAESKYH